MPASALPSQIIKESHDGDTSALLSLHRFCLDYNVKNHSTFMIILDVVFHNLRPELQPTFHQIIIRREDAHLLLKPIAICISILLSSINSMLGIRIGEGPTLSLRSLPQTSCRKIAEHWENHIWPCAYLLTEWYILNETQPPISTVTDIHQGSLNTTLSALFDHLSQPTIGINIRNQMRRTKGIPLCAIRLLVQALDWHPHSSSMYLKSTSTFAYPDPDADRAEQPTPSSVLYELERNSLFIPSVLAYLPRNRNSLAERAGDLSWVLSFLAIVFQGSARLLRQVAAQHPALLTKLMQILHRLIHILTLQNTARAIRHNSLYLLMILAELISRIMAGGGFQAQRQAVKHGLLRATLQIEAIGSMGTVAGGIVSGFVYALSPIAPSLCQYSVLTCVLRDLETIKTRSIDKTFVASTAAELQGLQNVWSEFCDLAMARVPVLSEYKEYIMGTIPFCSLSTCPRDMKTNTHRCFICKRAYYCSRRCQKRDWAAHKSSCQPPSREFSQMNDLDKDFAEYQLSYGIEHNWSKSDRTNIDSRLDTMKYLICDIQSVPPVISILPPMFNHSTSMLNPAASLAPDADLAWIFVKMDPPVTKSGMMYARAPEDLVRAALAGKRIMRGKGERLVKLKDDGKMPLSDEWQLNGFMSSLGMEVPV